MLRTDQPGRVFLPIAGGWQGAYQLTWLLCLAIAMQAFGQPASSGAAWLNEQAPQSEEESDPLGSQHEEEPAALAVPAAKGCRLAQGGRPERKSILAVAALRQPAAWRNAASPRPSECLGRNGMGGPLRC